MDVLDKNIEGFKIFGIFISLLIGYFITGGIVTQNH